MRNRTPFKYAVVLLGLLQLTAMGMGGSVDPNSLFDMSLEDLMTVPIVVSAGRTAQAIDRLSVPVGIITADDIHYSGLTSIPEILQFTPGVDVVPMSRVQYAVGVRGMHDFIADRTLTLIDGRNADSPLFGGSEFYRYPLLMEDIERIEVVRGPGGAAWGANAFTGIINIITKEPGQEPGWLLSSTVNEYGDTYNHIRHSGSRNQWRWRTSVGYEDFEDSASAGAGDMVLQEPAIAPLIGFNSFTPQDYARNLRLDTEFAYDYSEDTQLSFGTGYSHLERGDWEMLGYYPGGRAWYETVRSFARIQHEFDDETSGYLQWSGNFNNSRQPSLLKWQTFENDFEAQLNKQIDSHQLSVGGNLRFTRIETESLAAESFTFPNAPFDELTAGVFLIDRIKMSDQLELEGQFRSDWYSETHRDWSTRLSALYALDADKKHNLRFSFARAFRTPFVILRNSQTQRVFHPGLPGYLLNLDSLVDLDNEETWSVEMGISSQLADGVVLRSDAYFQRFDDLIGFENTPTFPTTFTADNIDGADSWGAETELCFRNDIGQLSLWYAYNDFEADGTGQKVRSYLPAAHKAGVTGRLFMDHDTCLNVNYRYTDTTDVAGETRIFPIDMVHRLDVTVSKAFANQRGEVMIGVSDLLNETRDPKYISGTITAFEMPGRTVFARLQLRF